MLRIVDKAVFYINLRSMGIYIKMLYGFVFLYTIILKKNMYFLRNKLIIPVKEIK